MLTAFLAGCLCFHALGAEVASFPAGDGAWQLGTLAVGNLDGSPDLEIVVPYRNSSGGWVLDAFKWNGTRVNGFPHYAGSEEINVSPTLYDLDGDGRVEILFTQRNHLLALRGTGQVIWSNPVTSATYLPNGGYQTITNGFYWSDGGGFMPRLPDTAVFSSQVSPPLVVDLNGDGKLEVITGWKIDPDPAGSFQDFNPFINDIYGSGEWGTVGETWSGGVVLFDALNGAQKFVYHIHQLVESGLAVGRPKPAGARHVYVLNDSDSIVCFDHTQPHGFYGKGMLHKQFGKNQRLMSGAYQMSIDVQLADLDGDGLDEVLVAGTQLGTGWQPNETILDDDGTILWRNWKPQTNYTHAYGWRNSAALIPVNPDHDNHIDVLGYLHGYETTFRYWNGIELVDRPGWPKNFYPLLPTPPVMGDVDGDGEEEILLGTYHPAKNPSEGNLLIYALDGQLKQSVPVPGGLKHIPSLADVNGDGSLDVVYRSLLGQVYVQNFGAQPGARVSWSTHRGNARRDGNSGQTLYPEGTPRVSQKSAGFERVSLDWSPVPGALTYHLRRSLTAGGPFVNIVTLTTNLTSYTDSELQNGWQYFYEVGANFGTNTIYSAPVALVPGMNSNLLVNGHFEQNDNSHWDKWFTGDLKMANMFASTDSVFAGRRAMEVRLENNVSGASVAQFCQYGIPDASLWVTPGTLYSFGGWVKPGGLTQPSEHWFEWASGKTGSDTNTRPSLPYPNYFTPHLIADTTAADWSYLNRVFVMPAGFPNVDFRHKYKVATPASGSVFLDDLFFRPLPPLNSPQWVTWIPFRSEWRYSTEPPGVTWAEPNFDDSTWKLGLTKMGAGDGPTNIVTRLPQYLPGYLFRKKFVVPETQIQEFLLAATCTDNYSGQLQPLRLWLNGHEVRSSGIDTVSGQGNELRYFDLLPFAKYIVPGTNTIAVRVGNVWTSAWDDVAFDISLRVVPHQLQPVRLSVTGTPGILAPTGAAETGQSVQLTALTPTGSIWDLQSGLALNGPWQRLTTFTNLTGAPFQYVDQCQAEGGAKFYRLKPL